MGLECRNISVERHTGGRIRPILDSVSVRFREGAMTLVTGPNGAGKTTLLHVLAGMLKPTSGELWAAGESVSRWKAFHKDIWRRQVGIVFQNIHLLSGRTVLENVSAPLIPRAASRQALLYQTQSLLEQMDLFSLRHESVDFLSGGRRQCVAIARALVVEPRFLLLDEPTSFLDNEEVRKMTALWRKQAAGGACVVVCSHDARLSGSNGFLQKGEMDQGRLEMSA